MATVISRLEAVLHADTSQFDRSMDKSERKTGGFSSGVTKAAKLAGLGIVGGLGLAVHAAAGFEQSLNTLQAVTGVTGKELDKFRKEAIKLGADTKLPATSAADAAAAMTELSKAGLSVKNTMEAARPVLVLSAAAGISNARAAEIAANALNSFHLRGKEAALVADELANVANASSVEINDVADSFKMASAVFSGFQGPAVGAKKAMLELNVAIAELGNAGIKGSDAGTSLKQMLLQLTGPTQQAQQLMEALYYAAQHASISEQELTTIMHGTKKERDKAMDAIVKHNKGIKEGGDIAYDASGKMRSLNDIIKLTTLGTKDLTQEQRNNILTTIFGADATRSVITLMRAQGAEHEKLTKTVQKRGAADDLAAAKMKGFNGTIDAAKSSIQTLEIVIGTGLLPIMTSLASTISVAANAAAAHTTITKVLIGAVTAFVAIVFIANTYMKIMASTFVVKVIPAIIKTTAVQWALNVALTANPIGIVIVALAALGVAMVAAYYKVKFFREGVNAAWSWIKEHWPLLVGIMMGPIGVVIEQLIVRRERIIEIFRNLPGQIAGAFTAGAGLVKDAIVGLFHKVIGWVKGALGISSPSKVFYEIGRNSILGFVHGVGSMAGVLKNAVINIAKSIPGKALGALGGVLGGEIKSAPGIHSAYSAEKYLVPWAQREGIGVTSIATGNHVAGSYHYKHRAIDVSGSAAQMQRFFLDSVRHFGSNLTELFYDPMGYYFKNGRRVGGAIGGHSDHVHIALDKGGIFTKPWAGMVSVAERNPEGFVPLRKGSAFGGTTNNYLSLPNYVGSHEELAGEIFDVLQDFQNRNGRPAYGSGF